MTLDRIWFFETHIIGVLQHEDFRCFILELPWRDNQKNISCIPVGEFEMVRRNSQRYGLCWEILVPGRTDILVHWGNYPRNTMGCLVGGSGVSRDLAYVLESRRALLGLDQATMGITKAKINVRIGAI